MLVDNYTDYSTDLSDIFDTELFNPADFALDSTDYLDSFPISDFSSVPAFPLPQVQLPYFASTSSSSSLSSPSPFLVDNDNPIIGIDPQLVDTPSAVTDHGDEDDSELDEIPSSTALPPSSSTSIPPSATSQKPTITIPPTSSNTNTAAAAAAAAHKSRKGTVLSGGIVKKSLHPSTKEKENNALALGVAAAKKTAATKHARNPSVTSSSSSSSPFGLSTISEENKASFASLMASVPKRAPREMSVDIDDDNDQELPQDWRPSPEVLAKMTSKEKRQLRNKISARNFRIRRKEYISTLEGDIAERDRLLDHFRTQLGTRESENLALRQEIAALKKSLLDGRLDPSALSAKGGDEAMMMLEEGVSVGGLNLHLPPPKMLPEQSAAEVLMLAESASSPATATVNTNMTMGLLTPNTQKDLPTSRVGSSTSSGFWGGVGMGGMGGITPVHTTLVPDMSVVLRRALMENINPSLNQGQAQQAQSHTQPGTPLGGFDGFADAHPFTLKTLDAYRMHLWGKMAAQQSHHHHHHHHSQQSPSSSRTASPSPPTSPSGLGYLYPSYGQAGLAERLRPHFFSSFGKHAMSSSSSSYPTPPGSPVFAHKSIGTHSQKEKDQQQQQQQQVLIAAMASQTILKKLGSAFWDAFVGSSSSPSSSSSATSLSSAYTTNSSSSGGGNWDTDKVKRILEGKAVLRVVDVDSLPPSPVAVSSTSAVTAASEKVQCERKVCELLEESMRSLTIGKKG